MNRINSAFQRCKSEGRTALITYLTAGHPTLSQTPLLVEAMVKGGADLVEIGIPYSDPLADGPIIQSAALQALQGGVTVDAIFNMVISIRKTLEVPLLFMVYYSTIFRFGTENFIRQCAKVGVDGLIIPDLPLEERDEMSPMMKEYGLVMVPLVAPTSRERIREITASADGFVYCVSTLGVTGESGRFHADIFNYLDEVRDLSPVPIAVGFGITKREHVIQLAPHVDGVIVGSAIVKLIDETKGNIAALEDYIRTFKDE